MAEESYTRFFSHLLVFFMLLCLLLSVEEHKIYPYDYKRNTQPLSHIQRHAVFKVYLVFFQELYEEAEYKDLCQAESEEEATVQLFAVVLIQENHNQEEDEIGDGLVKLCRMAGQHIHSFKNKCPGHIGCFTNDFGVHQVGKTDEASANRIRLSCPAHPCSASSSCDSTSREQ